MEGLSVTLPVPSKRLNALERPCAHGPRQVPGYAPFRLWPTHADELEQLGLLKARDGAVPQPRPAHRGGPDHGNARRNAHRTE
jgi:hypothetical protein